MNRWLRALAPYALSMLLHAVVGVSLAAGALFVAGKILAPPPLEVELVTMAPATELDDDDEEPRTAKAAAPLARARPRPRLRKAPARSLTPPPQSEAPVLRPELVATPVPEAPPPAPRDAPVREGPPSPPVYGVALDSADTGGGTFAMPHGNRLAPGAARGGSPGGSGERARGFGALVRPEAEHEITTWPERIDDRTFRYPERARREGVEGTVSLRLAIDADGRVVSVRLLRPSHPDLDRAALEGARLLRFRPARKGRRAVACEIPYKFTFVLD